VAKVEPLTQAEEVLWRSLMRLVVTLPRALGDVVLCPQVTGDAWRAPLTHGVLHLLGYDHGAEMERRERELDGR